MTIDLEAVDVDLEAKYPHIKCAKYADLLDFHFAVDGSGPLANEWVDKPHRLVYRLTGMLSDLRDARRARDAEVGALVEAVGMAADTLDNLIHAMAMPLPDELHMKALRLALPDLLEEMRAALLPFTGDKP